MGLSSLGTGILSGLEAYNCVIGACLKLISHEDPTSLDFLTLILPLEEGRGEGVFMAPRADRGT